MFYLVVTIILYAVGFFAWLGAGAIGADYPRFSRRQWKRWRAALPIGLLTLWLWPVVVPAVILWYLMKFSKDAWDLIWKKDEDYYV